MHKKIAALSLSILSVLAALLCQCTLSGLSGGGTEDVNTKVTGMVFNPDRTPASHAQVLLIAADYDPVRSARDAVLTDTTNEAGEYRFTVSKSGLYNAQIVDIAARTRAMVARMPVVGETAAFPPAELSKPGVVKVMVQLNANTTNGYMYIPGTTVFAYLQNGSGFVMLDSVPADMAADIAYSTTNTYVSTVLRYGVQVKSSDTTVVWNSGWNYSRKIILNTSSSGASVAGAVTGFPVLVRLTGDNFDFTQAGNNGEDIRFTKPDNTFLPYEIERWDPVAGLAEVWVKVDTVRGGDSTQSLTMYWGASAGSATSSMSNGAAVFDSASGFEGVWHLNETSGARAADASHNGFTGTYKGGLPRGESGPLGICQNIMRPDTDYVDMGNVLNPGVKNFSIGVWLKRRALGTQQAIIAKTNGNAPSAAYGYLFNFDSDNLPHLYMATGSGSWGGDSTFDVKTDLAIADSTTWHYVFVVIDRSDNALCKMYVDGIDRTGHIGGNITHISAIVNAINLHIGTESDHNCSFSGSLGEATIAFTARSADWVKLCYMNQKAQDELIGFK
jgi:hypothetical protein